MAPRYGCILSMHIFVTFRTKYDLVAIYTVIAGGPVRLRLYIGVSRTVRSKIDWLSPPPPSPHRCSFAARHIDLEAYYFRYEMKVNHAYSSRNTSIMQVDDNI